TARRVSAVSSNSDLLRLAGAEDAAGPEDEHEDEDREGDHVAELVRPRDVEPREEQRRPDGFEETEQQPAQRRAGDASDAAEDGGREGLDPGDETHEWSHDL